MPFLRLTFLSLLLMLGAAVCWAQPAYRVDTLQWNLPIQQQAQYDLPETCLQGDTLSVLCTPADHPAADSPGPVLQYSPQQGLTLAVVDNRRFPCGELHRRKAMRCVSGRRPTLFSRFPDGKYWLKLDGHAADYAILDPTSGDYRLGHTR